MTSNYIKTKKPLGRPTKLTPQLQAKICDIIANGNYLVTACNVVGIDKNTFTLWMTKAREEEDNGQGIYYGFMVAVKKAEAQAEEKLAQFIRETALDKKDGYLGMTFLERRHPERWGRRERPAVALVAEDNRQYNIVVADEQTKDELKRLLSGERRQIPQDIGQDDGN